jgi:hypothetical protein
MSADDILGQHIRISRETLVAMLEELDEKQEDPLRSFDEEMEHGSGSPHIAFKCVLFTLGRQIADNHRGMY